MNERLLVIDDDVELCELLSERLEREGFSVDSVHDGAFGLHRARSGEHSLVILDLMLPKLCGLEVLRQLRTQSGIPVLILTARGEDVDRIIGLEIGADDYLPKPFNPRELIARVNAILRRTSHIANDVKRIAAGDIVLDGEVREAWVGNKQVDLTTVEFALLKAFLDAAGRVLSRETLTQAVLGRQITGPFDRVIDVHVSNLRKKLGDSPGGERIKAVRGAGYIFVARSMKAKE